MADGDVVQIQVTHDDPEQLATIVEALVAARLIACGQLGPRIASTYRWRGAIEQATEWMAFLKTRADRVDAVVAKVNALHPYEVPEVIVTPIVGGLDAYLKWIHDEVD